ncbi:unnamed protein product [Rhizophagus irregularis]|nr:unnamed protein product [Rhizophagus irregularis]
MWWDVISSVAPMITACHKLFQVNKNPSDTEVEQAFKLQVQADFPQKIQELVNSNEWNNLWKAMHSIPYRNCTVEKSERITKARHNFWKKMDDSDQKSPCIIEVILQRAFSKEELQNENNIKFGVIVVLMFLDPTYD